MEPADTQPVKRFAILASAAGLSTWAIDMAVTQRGIILIATGAVLTFSGGLLSNYVIVLIGRGIEGLDAALFIPASTALLVDVFTQQERGMAQGQMMMISMFVTAFAPTVAGLIIQAIAWPYAYLMTIVSATITFLLLSKVKYNQKQSQLTPFDHTGSALLFVAVSLLTIGIMQAGTVGFTSPFVFIPVANS